MTKNISIGEASKLTGLPAKTIRFYEEIKLFAPSKRLENSYRSYSEEDLAVLFLVKEAKSLGLPLKDIKEVVHLCISRSCETAHNFLKTKMPLYLAEIEYKISELKDLQKRLHDFNRSVTQTNGQDCLICTKDC